MSTEFLEGRLGADPKTLRLATMAHALVARKRYQFVLNLPPGEGVLASQQLLALMDDGVIHAGDYTIPPENVQPASLDLRLDEVAYRIQCSFLPDRQTVEQKVKDYIIDEIPLDREGVVLETKRPYLIPLKERLSLPAGMRGKTNPKSSTGRLDVFTRVITDESYRFDEIAAGYEGRMYLEVVPLSFPIRVRENLTLNQLRISIGRAELSDDDIRALHRSEPLLFHDGVPLPPSSWPWRTACSSDSISMPTRRCTWATGLETTLLSST